MRDVISLWNRIIPTLGWENESVGRVIHRYMFTFNIDSLSVKQIDYYRTNARRPGFAHIHKYFECEFNSNLISFPV